MLVATIRALKHHGGSALADLVRPDVAAVHRGLENLAAHLDSALQFGRPVVVAINRFTSDSDEELTVLRDYCRSRAVPCAVADVFGKGGDGAAELADTLVGVLCDENAPDLPMLYRNEDSVEQKLHTIATRIYGADGVVMTDAAKTKLSLFTQGGFQDLPICMAKTQDSLSDNPKLFGRPRGFTLTVRDFEIANGAGFLVALTGQMMRMPALPRVPAAERIDVTNDGTIIGI